MFKKRNTNPGQCMVLDTCALIDGRIIAIAKAGFVPECLIIPQFVIAELQYLADTGDSQKRERARFGLDVIRDLQDTRRTTVQIARETFNQIKEVDDKLIALAKLHHAMLYTTDYNLNKVAQIEGVTVLNVNELAQALRPPRLPGEQVEIKITQVGQDKTQGVGYLEDGTMVVVEQANKLIGQRVRVEFSRILQTQAGKMMFAVLPAHSPQAAEQPKPPQQQSQPQPKAQHQHVAHPKPHSAPEQHSPKHNNHPGHQRQTARTSPEDSLIAAVRHQPN